MIIGLSGYAQSGKNTVAGILIGLHKYQNRAYADAIRDAVYSLNPVIKEGFTVQSIVNAYGWENSKVTFPEIRRLLQVMGTEVGRSMFGENVWVDKAMEGLEITDRIVFTDVRFPNEALAIKQMMGEVWRIERPGVLAVNTHVSEHALDTWNFDAVIQNSEGVDGLIRKVERLVSSYVL